MATTGFYRRALPETLIPFASPEGRALFREALAAGGMEGWFSLAEQFHTQSDPAFCGLGTLVIVLNALAIDPGRTWKGPWRWYSEELLDCCRPLDVVRARGITLEEFACLARCNGAHARVTRAADATLDAFRREVREAATTAGEPHVALAYTRKALGQTGDGHFSPLGGWHEARDLVLLLDVARFKYPPHWVPLATLWDAMQPPDPATGRSRGWVTLARGAGPAAVLCRFALEGVGWGEVARQLVEVLPGALAASGAATPEEAVAATFRALPREVADVLTTYDGAATAAWSDDLRAAAARLLDAIRGTALYAVVRRALPAGVQSHELATVFVLLCPDATFQVLAGPAREAFAALRDPAALPPALAAEVAALRAQMATLEEHRRATSG